MRSVSVFSALVFWMLHLPVSSQTKEVIADMPAGDYTIRRFSAEELIVLEKLSDDFSGLAKIIAVDSLHPDGILAAEKWPEGSWGRGYQSWPKIKFYPKNASGFYWACHPLIRDAARFTMGHLYLYQDDTTRTTSKRLTQAGIDFLLEEQIKNGVHAGHFMWWLKREGLENLNMEKPVNTIQPYETCGALVTLAEFYQAGLPYRRQEVKDAIDLSTNTLLDLNWFKDTLVGNSNMRALGMWSLSAVYKINPQKKIYAKVKQLTTDMIRQQNKDDSSENGLWQTGSTESVDGYKVYHDTKIYYHLMILRGLIASFSIIPDSEKGYKTKVADAIKRGFNHLIRYRIDRNNIQNFKLRYASKTVDGQATPDWFSFDAIDVDQVIEPLVKMAYYSKSSPYFSQAEHINLCKLAFQVTRGLTHQEVWHTGAIGCYLHYMKGLDQPH